MYKKLLLFILTEVLATILVFPRFSNYPYCLAEEQTNTTTNQELTNLKKKIVDFSNGPQVFQLNNFWKIQDGELRFFPNEFSKSYFNYLTFQEFSLSNYILSVDARWISGSDYSPYGLLFKYYNNSYYAFVTTVNGEIMLLKYNKKWKTIKRFKNRNSASNTFDSLKVVCNGPLIKCFVNEKKVFEYKDKSQMQEASVGLCSDGDINSGFKNFKIEELPDDGASIQ